MEVGLIKQWAKVPAMQMPPSDSLMEAKELVLGADGELSAQARPVGSNKIGMAAWLINMKTPEYPDGRDVVVIANDEKDPAKGFKYLYLTEEDYQGLEPGTVEAQKT